MELKKGSQTSKPKRAEVSLDVEGAVPQQLTGNRSNAESVPEEIDNSRISTDASTLTSSVDDGFVPPDKEKEYDVSNEALYKLEEYFQSTSTSSTSRISSVTHKSSIQNKHPPPPIQVMDRSSFDSSRIPSSIFAKPATIMDWSIVSNESLFSIQIGKESLARHGFMLEELDHSQEFSINEGSYSFKDLNELEESVKSDDEVYQPEQVKESGDQLGICNKTISKENEEKLQHALPKMKIEGFGNGKPNQALSEEKSPKSSCSDSGCTLCNCFSISSCCSCKCFSFPTCGCDSWPSCSGKSSCCWSDCSSCGSKPSTWEWCKCRCPTWSIEKIFCCLSSKSSAKFPSGPRKDSDTDARSWCTCFSCYSCC